MRKLITTLFILLPTIGFSAELAPWQKSVLEEVKAETSVLDAFWRDAGNNVLYVSRAFDGTRHDGFASYLCLTANHTDAPPESLKTIWVYDPASFEAAKTGSAEAMGLAVCR